MAHESSRGTWRKRLIPAWPYLYLLRVPILTAILLVGLAPIAYFLASAASLLANLFALDAPGIFVVSLAAFKTAWTIMITWRLILLYGHERFGVARSCLREHQPLGRRTIMACAAMALPIVGYAVAQSTSALGWRLLAAVLGFLAALGVLMGAQAAQLFFLTAQKALHVDSLLPPLIPEGNIRSWLVEARPRVGLVVTTIRWVLRHLPRWVEPGILVREQDEHGHEVVAFRPGHGLVFGLLVTSALIYVLTGVIGYWQLSGQGHVPALALILLLLLLLCLGLSGVAFLFDRVRVPILLLLVIFFGITTWVLPSDYYYQVSALDPPVTRLPAAEAIRVGNRPGAIVVAANGGGIQAAAWTARVLSGLERKSRDVFGDDFRAFGASIRMISSVSGGSVGAMHFTHAYAANGLPATDAGLDQIVDRAASSSLDAVVWGMVYPDFLRTVIPGVASVLNNDRGRVLEEAWTRHAGPQGDHGPLPIRLSDWREDVRQGRRPATIFNATIADTGERFLLSTSDFREPQAGRLDFYQQYPTGDISPVTAARLSATFPYVTPAARASTDFTTTAQFHVVDGGYYDNFGMATLVEWLDEALKPPDNPINRVLVLQIRGAPVGTASKQARAQPRGWFYQVFAPVATLLNVRNAGQLSHNDIELDLLRRLWSAQGNRSVRVDTAIFRFNGPNPPLSWHLTKKQRQAIEASWDAQVDQLWPPVQDFLCSQPEVRDHATYGAHCR